MKSRAIFTLGLPGSGKSTFLKVFEESNKFITVSADEIRLTLPNYDPQKPELVHETCVKMAEERVYELMRQNKDLIMDGGSINDHYTERIIKELQANNYEVEVHFINTPVHICIQRNNERKARGERFVPTSAIIDKHYKLDDSVTRLNDLVPEGFYVYDYFTRENLIVDMDGVVAAYQNLPLDDDGNINFVSHNIFRNAIPVLSMINRIKTYADSCNIYILSASPNSICNEEKREWLREHMPFVMPENIYFLGNKDFKWIMLRDLMTKLGLKPFSCTLVDDEHSVLESCKKLGVEVLHPSAFLVEF